jgi:hypothetical protein
LFAKICKGVQSRGSHLSFIVPHGVRIIVEFA